jgi:hypothetical protein
MANTKFRPQETNRQYKPVGAEWVEFQRRLILRAAHPDEKVFNLWMKKCWVVFSAEYIT